MSPLQEQRRRLAVVQGEVRWIEPC